MKIVKTLVVCSAGMTLAACSTTPDRINELEQARAAVQQVESSSLAGQYAAKETEAAHNALGEAERMASEKKPLVGVRHMAYIAKRHADIAQEQITAAEAKNAMEQAEAQRQQIVAQGKQAEANAAQRQAEMSADDAQRRAAMLEDELSQLKAKKTDRGLVLTLGDVLFDTGKSTLKSGAMANLDRLAQFLKDSPDRSVTIEGHTDSVGSDDYNMELSQRRAEAVRMALAERGVPSDRLNALGKGKAFPIAGNETAAGRQQNRRVEIVISNPEKSAVG